VAPPTMQSRQRQPRSRPLPYPQDRR
jgi:hypothetical protein